VVFFDFASAVEENTTEERKEKEKEDHFTFWFDATPPMGK
jgi:hypothetical protein